MAEMATLGNFSELALLLKFVGFDQRDPGVFREMVGKKSRARFRSSGKTARGFADNENFGEFIETPLRLSRECANGFNLIAEELQSIRRVGVRREDIENAAASGELAVEFNGIDALEAVIDEPLQKRFDIDRFAFHKAPAAFGKFGPRRDRLHQGSDGGQDQPRGIGGELLDDAQSLAGNLIEESLTRRPFFPGGEDERFGSGEGAQIMRPRFDIAEMRQHDEKCGRGVAGKRCGRQRGR
jgi:hypothetical protein